MISKPAPSFTLADIIARFDSRAIEKARPYLGGAIQDLSVGDDYVSATVQGTARKPYHVGVHVLRDRRGEPHFESHCSCPVVRGCKHAVAALIATLQYRQAHAGVNPEVLAWAERLRDGLNEDAKPVNETLVYILQPPAQRAKTTTVHIHKARLGSDGAPKVHAAQVWTNIDGALRKKPRFVRDQDMPILRLLAGDRYLYGHGGFLLGSAADELALGLMLDTGRLYLKDDPTPLHRGPRRSARLDWQEGAQGLHPRVIAEPEAHVLALQTLWYVDGQTLEAGALTTDEDPRLLNRLLSLPPLSEHDLPIIGKLLAELAPTLAPPGQAGVEQIDVAPVPVLSLHTLAVRFVNGYRAYPGPCDGLDVAELAFMYEGLRFGPDDKAGLVKDAQGRWVDVKRRPDAEARWTRQLRKHGLTRLPAKALFVDPGKRGLYGLESEEAWIGFMADHLPRLRAAGWRIDLPDDFRHLWQEPEGWDAELREDEPGWFDLDMGVMIEGRRLALTPMLSALLERDPRWLDAAFLDQQPDDAGVILTAPDGPRVRVDAGRVKTIVRQLIDLFDRPHGDALRLNALDAARLAALPGDMPPRGAVQALEMARRIQGAGAPVAVEPPEGLGLELRPYQREGLGWLSHLRELGLGGILADDMGLGKTAQTLAFLLRERQIGRLDRPALIVLPTSLLFNWRREAERIAPALRVLTLHGADRHEAFERLGEHDLVLTTYPLLWRDIEQLERQHWSQLILDEAQTVKNASSQAAQAIRRLETDHRLCLTGTPMENHLGELWSQFDFLLPGLLGDKTAFTRAFRTPIEKHGDSVRRDLLARRLRPFMLRRRKEDVASELPPKTIIVRAVELEGAQRDLYETVRSAMDEKVRQSIASMGMSRSHIVILDALLKLRQVCCDPRLLPNRQGGKRAMASAKLDLLMDMLPELVEEGRRILVFSQFTSMLDLISQALTKARLAHVTLTGQTRDREAVVRQFQDGDIPIFLISLKAGGVGLNLTAADTVIHYDPWWNPAVEDQATDRAHRIGQTRQVFVYKLVAEGSIEEKILALQEKKAELAAGVLGEDASALTKFSEADLQALMAPLPLPAMVDP